MRLYNILICFLLTTGCDSSSGTTPRNGESSDTGGELCPPAVAMPIVVATPEETEACACEPMKGEDACVAGLDCVQTAPGVHRCLAPQSGPVEGGEGGEYLTFCAINGVQKAFTATVDNETLYCSACMHCKPPEKGSLACRE